MKILVFSDSHRSRVDMIDTIEQQQPDQVIHLGDLLQDAQDLTYVFPRLPIACVPGNCDGWTNEPLKNLITLEGQKILFSHGHLWHVKSGFEAAIADARKCAADILLFGHTHQPYCRLEDGLWVMNPGASRQSYGTILIQPGETRCFITRMS